NKKVLPLAILANGIHVRMLDKKHVIVCRHLLMGFAHPVFTFYSDQLLKEPGLVVPCLLVLHQAEVFEPCFAVNYGIHVVLSSSCFRYNRVSDGSGSTPFSFARQ